MSPIAKVTTHRVREIDRKYCKTTGEEERENDSGRSESARLTEDGDTDTCQNVRKTHTCPFANGRIFFRRDFIVWFLIIETLDGMTRPIKQGLKLKISTSA